MLVRARGVPPAGPSVQRHWVPSSRLAAQQTAQGNSKPRPRRNAKTASIPSRELFLPAWMLGVFSSVVRDSGILAQMPVSN